MIFRFVYPLDSAYIQCYSYLLEIKQHMNNLPTGYSEKELESIEISDSDIVYEKAVEYANAVCEDEGSFINHWKHVNDFIDEELS